MYDVSQFFRLILSAAILALLSLAHGAENNEDMYPPEPAAAAAVNFDGKGFVIDGERTFIASGSIHYPRVPRGLWRDRLLRLKRSGLNTVETYAFMNWHTSERGVYDFSGEKDFDAFLQTADDLGLYSIMRPGMYVCAEWENGGYPNWLLQTPGLSLRNTNSVFLDAHDEWYARILPIIAAHQIHRGGSVILMQLENEHPELFGVDHNNSPFFQHILTDARERGIEVPLFFSGYHHSADPAGTASWDSAGRTAPWLSTEYWAGWYDEYGASVADTTARDRGTWKILAYGGNGYNYYMFHGGTNFDHWNNQETSASYDYGAALGQAGDLRPLYYRDKRAALFARTFQAILANSTKADATYSGAATGVTAITARTSPAGTILFLDNTGSAASTATLANGAKIVIEPQEIVPVVKNFALRDWLTLVEADARILGAQPQGDITTLVLYGLAGESVRAEFLVTDGGISSASAQFAVAGDHATLTATVTDGVPAAYRLVSGARSLRVLVMTKGAADRIWFVDSGGANYVVSGPAYVGEFSNAGGVISATLEEPLGNPVPTNLRLYGPDSLTPSPLVINNAIEPGLPAAPALTDWQMHPVTDRAAIDYDDSAWASFPGATPPVLGADGSDKPYGWYRTTINAPSAGLYTLAFPVIRDRAIVYLNGQKIATQTGATAFNLSAQLETGPNSLAIFTSHAGRNKLAWTSYLGTAFQGEQKGLRGPVSVASQTLTSWYWRNTNSNTAPSASSIAQITAVSYDPAANGWSTGSAWSGDVFNNRAGYAWFRATLPDLTAPRTIQFSNVDDNCSVYLNGNLLGTHTGWGVPFEFSLDSFWQPGGPNVLTVLVRNTSGSGGINGSVTVNPIAGAITGWKLQGVEGREAVAESAWEAVAATGAPTHYRAHFAYQAPAGQLPILRVGVAGLSRGTIWLNGHALGRYPEKIGVNGLYLPECWLAAENVLEIFDEQGASPTGVTLGVEVAASRQILEVTASSDVPIPQPDNLVATASDGQVDLSWFAVDGATSYTIRRAANPGGPYVNLATGVSGTGYVDASVANGTRCYYVVSAVLGDGSTTLSSEVSAMSEGPRADLLNPGFESPGVSKISTGFSTVAGWKNAGTTYADSGVEASPASHGGAWHAYAKGSDGGAYQLTGYKLRAGDRVTLSWWAEHTGGAGASSQIVRLICAQSAGDAYSTATPLATYTGSLNGSGAISGPWAQYSLSFTATVAEAGKCVGVFFNNATTTNWAGFDDFVLTVDSPPLAPATVSVEGGDGVVSLVWSAVSGAETYAVQRAFSGSANFVTVAGGLATAQFTDTGLTNGVAYLYRVFASNALGDGPVSDAVLVTPLTGFQAWKVAHGMAFDAPAASAPDGDSIALLLKYATGIEPGESAAAVMPVALRASDGVLEFHFERRDPPPVDFVVEASDDLIEWTSVASLSVGETSWRGAAAVTESGAGVLRSVTVIPPAEVASEARVFLRLKVIESP